MFWFNYQERPDPTDHTVTEPEKTSSLASGSKRTPQSYTSIHFPTWSTGLPSYSSRSIGVLCSSTMSSGFPCSSTVQDFLVKVLQKYRVPLFKHSTGFPCYSTITVQGSLVPRSRGLPCSGTRSTGFSCSSTRISGFLVLI